MERDEGKWKSARRVPLRDVSNRRVKSSKSVKKNKEEVPQRQDRSDTEDPLDLLLLVHSDISSLLRQIDELVVQAVKVKTINNQSQSQRDNEIESFANELSGIRSSLKPWVSRLQNAASISLKESEIQLSETTDRPATLVDEGDDHEVNTPKPTKQESLVSPSPLVSWRAADCIIETGKQLFMLTPLPRPRASTSKAHASMKPTTSEGITLSTAARVTSLCAKASDSNHNIAKSTPLNSTLENSLKSVNVENTSDLGFLSPSKFTVGDFSTLLVTPCLKIPRPRSCVLIEPNDEFSNRKIHMPRKSTPFPVGNKLCESTDSGSSSDEVSQKLGLKYPELVGIKPSCMLRNGSKALEASPAWIMSPPKSCILLEPPDEKPPKGDARAPLDCCLNELAATFSQQTCLAPPNKNSIQIEDHDQENKNLCTRDNLGGSFAMVQSTPMWKGLESTIQRGKRPGENTLKKELWTKFEAASTNGVRLNFSIFEDASQKGFLDRLEEASCDEMSPHPNTSLR